MSKNPKKLIVIGDSGVYGWGDRDEGGWCERVRKKWMGFPHSPVIYPLGVRGDGLEKVAQRWENEWNSRGEMRRQVPNGLLLSVGINDTACVGRPDGRPQLSAEAFRFGLLQLLKQIKLKTKVMVIGLTPVDESVMPFAECLWYSNKAGSVYEAQIEEACLELDIPFLPLHKAMISEPNWMSWIEPDGIHLNSYGHYWISQRVLNWPYLLKWAELEQLGTLTPSYA